MQRHEVNIYGVCRDNLIALRSRLPLTTLRPQLHRLRYPSGIKHEDSCPGGGHRGKARNDGEVHDMTRLRVGRSTHSRAARIGSGSVARIATQP